MIKEFNLNVSTRLRKVLSYAKFVTNFGLVSFKNNR